MPNRREFLHATAMAALPLAARALPVAPAVTFAAPGPRLALVQPGSTAARQFGERLAARGAELHDVPPHDPAPLWFDHLQPLWSRERAPVAGLTGLATLFCLEQFAWAHGLRVVFHAEHRLHADGTVSHELLRGADLTQLAQPAVFRTRAWPREVADALAAALPHARGLRPGPSVAGLEPAVPPGTRVLASWLIA